MGLGRGKVINNQGPKLPERIIDAINENKLIVFFGAGISCLLGCPSWDDLSKKLIEKCFEEKLIT